MNKTMNQVLGFVFLLLFSVVAAADSLAEDTTHSHDDQAAVWTPKNAPVSGVPKNPIPINSTMAEDSGHIFNFYDEESGDYFIDAIGKFYGFKSISTQVTSMTGPGQGPPIHRHDTEELFLVLEGIGKFSINGEIHLVEAPAMIHVPAMVPHNVTTGGEGKNTVVTIYPTNQRTMEILPDHEDPFAAEKDQSAEIEIMQATFQAMIAKYDTNGDNRLDYSEIPEQTLYDINLFDINQDKHLDMDDLAGVR